MGFFSSLGKLGKAAVGTALLPVDAMKDTVTLGGVLTDDDSALVKRGRKIGQNFSEALDEIDDPDEE